MPLKSRESVAFTFKIFKQYAAINLKIAKYTRKILIEKKCTNAWILFGRVFGSVAPNLLISAIVFEQANKFIKCFPAQNVAAASGHVALAVCTYELFSKEERRFGIAGKQKSLQRENIHIPIF